MREFTSLKRVSRAAAAAIITLGAMLPAAGAAEVVRPTVADGSMTGYTLAWSDEFDGAALDLAKWDYRTDSKMWSTQKSENVSLSAGCLLLHLKKEEAEGMHYTGGGVISRQTFRCGFYEARLRTPVGAGWHTSFWMKLHVGKGGTGPVQACQELDVIENDSIHSGSYAVNIHKLKGPHLSFGTKTVMKAGLPDAFHVFGCEFTPQTVKYFCDGELVQSVEVARVEVAKKDMAFEHGDQHIWLTSIASSLGGTKKVDDSKLPEAAYFDYVRYFAPAENENAMTHALNLASSAEVTVSGGKKRVPQGEWR